MLGDGRLAILDFGTTRTIDRRTVDGMAAALQAFSDGDTDAFAAALEQLGWLPASHASAALELAREGLGELAGRDQVRLDNRAVVAARSRLLTRS